jgi:AraC-like DNA-binding protein
VRAVSDHTLRTLELTTTVACCVQSHTPRDLVSTTVRSLGARPIPLTWVHLSDLKAHPSWLALIYDLRPWDTRAVALLKRCGSFAPASPVLLYVPPLPGAGALLASCAREARVTIKLQFQDQFESERLAASVGHVLAQIPGKRLAFLLRAALPQMPERVCCSINSALDAVAHDQRPTVLQLATATGIGVRTLEREFAAAGLSRPKEFLNWLTLLYITLVSERGHQSCASVARVVGLCPSDFYRLRRRLLGTDIHPLLKSPPYTSELELALMAFLQRHRIPIRTRHRILEGMG